jgi:hypothetical protein
MIVNCKRENIQVFFRKFRIISVRFETVLFVSVVSIQVQNTETSRKRKVLVSRNKPKQTRNRSCFGLFRFELKIFIFHFEDTLGWALEIEFFWALKWQRAKSVPFGPISLRSEMQIDQSLYS